MSTAVSTAIKTPRTKTPYASRTRWDLTALAFLVAFIMFFPILWMFLTGFKSEQSKSAVVAGKMLMSMQQKGENEKGEVVRDYKALVQTVKQGAMEALNTEQIPPGYHDGIKSYFDALEKGKEKKKDK